MAGIERLEVHSKSYIVRWVRADAGTTLSWSVQPHKKSICFGIFKHPGSGATALASSFGEDGSHPPELDEGKAIRSNKKDTAEEILNSKGFVTVKWVGKCEADKVSIGTYDVLDGQGGMYGLVFDNTFSKQTSKTATFVVLTYPTGAPPQRASSIPNLQLPKSRDSQSSLGKSSPFHNDAEPAASTESFHSPEAAGRARSWSNRTDLGNAAPYHVGTLSKRRRKKGQGYARRFFSLDYSTYTLSYYYNRNSSALRGAIPLSLAAIAADERRREISIDSGAEVWHLRAPNNKEFQDWARALEKASRAARGLETSQKAAQTGARRERTASGRLQPLGQDEEAEWRQVETLVSRVVGTRDALRRLTKEVAALSKPDASSAILSPSPAIGEDGESYFPPVEKKSFWRRKSSAPMLTPSALQQASASALAVPSPGSGASSDANGSKAAKRRSKSSMQEEKSLHGHCESLLADLDLTVSEFTRLISTSKSRRLQVNVPDQAVSRLSMESTASTVDEFFDAEDAKSRVVKINESEDESAAEFEEDEEDDGSSISSLEAEDSYSPDGANHLYPVKSKTLTPLPISTAVNRRQTIPRATVLPPSLIAFVRKNVGKDLSTISMPVSANEPLSLLQKLSEQLEYAELLDKASKLSTPVDRLLFVTAFAVSQFSSGRAKERAIRKPFNPLLGETFELIRGESETPGGFRLLVEKVQHRPVKLAIHAESANWSLGQSAAPGQKFWGKSAEITTEGRVRVVLHLADGKDERYSWNIANMFLRNVVMGEKYVEPVGTMTVTNDFTGDKASIEFRSKGMFGGRSEEVHVDVLNPDGSATGSGMAGTWTTGLHMSGKGRQGGGDEVWHVGGLVDNAPQTYGLTRFAATLNEITPIEQGKMAPTDSRLRPDQRLAEDGKLDEAEGWKQRLEEAQRERRRQLEDSGGVHSPRWFVRVDSSPDGEECWRIKTGKDGYWEERAKGTWTGITEIFNA